MTQPKYLAQVFDLSEERLAADARGVADALRRQHGPAAKSVVADLIGALPPEATIVASYLTRVAAEL